MGAPELLTFDAATHTYRFMGDVVPGVTSILQPLVDFSGVPKHVLDAKRDLGKRVHEACHYFDEDDLDEESVEADVEPYLKAWQRFIRESGARVVVAEQPVFEPMQMYAGTLDAVIEYRGERYIIDRKTSVATPISTGPQTAAYQRALGDTSITRRAAVRLRADGTYRFDPLNGADDWSCFAGCLALHRFKEKHRD